MKAVNLMPDSPRGSVASPAALLNPAYGVIALLLVTLGLVTLYVLSSNNVSSRKAQLASLQGQVQTAQAQAAQLTNYVAYQKLAEQRVSTVQQITAGRFDWHAALSNLARVVPANAAFQSLLATAAPGATVSGAGGSIGAGTGALRSDIQSPAFEIKGCSVSHDDVARLLSRLRAMPGVQRVTLADSVRNPAGATGTAATATQQVRVCGHNPATFDLVVFFAPLPGAPTAATTPGAAPVATPAPATTPPSTSTTVTGTASAQPVSTGGSR